MTEQHPLPATVLITVKDYIDRLRQFPEEWPVVVATKAGGRIAIEHREIAGSPVIAVFGSNGGSFGEEPLTDELYNEKAGDFLRGLRSGRRYTTAYGDHRLYDITGSPNDGCWGTHYDERVIDRMVRDGILEYFPQANSRDGVRLKRAFISSPHPSTSEKPSDGQ